LTSSLMGEQGSNRLHETLSAIKLLWDDPQTHGTMQFYAGILVVMGLVYAFRLYRSATHKRAGR